MATATNKPVHVLRLRGVKASIFANATKTDGRETTFHKVALQKIYKEGAEFKTTTSLGRDDLPVAALLLQRAWEWVLETEANRPEKEDETSA